MKKKRFFGILAALVILTAPITAGADTTITFDMTVPGGMNWMNDVAPGFAGLNFGNEVGIIDQATATSLGWTGIEGSAGLFLPSGFSDFVIHFPKSEPAVSFLTGAPYSAPDGLSVLINGTPYVIPAKPRIITAVINSDKLWIEGYEPFTFDNLCTNPSTVPIPPSAYLLSAGLIRIFLWRRKKPPA